MREIKETVGRFIEWEISNNNDVAIKTGSWLQFFSFFCAWKNDKFEIAGKNFQHH